jgi:hypothetical protein
LLDMGQAWLETGDDEIRDEFFEEGLAMIEEGQADAVINVCQKLVGQVNDRAFILELNPLLQPAYRKLGVPYDIRRFPGGAGGPA